MWFRQGVDCAADVENMFVDVQEARTFTTETLAGASEADIEAVVNAWRLSHREMQSETDEFAATIARSAKSIVSVPPQQRLFRPPTA